MKQKLPEAFVSILGDANKAFLDQAYEAGYRIDIDGAATAKTTGRLMDSRTEAQVGYVNRDVVKDGVLGYTFRWGGRQANSCPVGYRDRLADELLKHHGLQPVEFKVQEKTVNKKPEVYVVLGTAEAAARVLGVSLGPAVFAVPRVEVGTFAAIESLREDTSLDATTREALIDARLGQGKFRQDLIKRFGGACAVTGCSFLPLLRASHIKPWRECTNAERLDPDNGLLLTANLDALFDRGLISFSEKGTLISSKKLPREVLAHLGPLEKLPLSLSPERSRYLADHRARLLK